MRLRAFAAAAFIACLAAGTVSCGSAIQDACIEANSIIASAGAYVDEAQGAINRAYDIVEVLPATMKQEALVAVRVADAALFAVTQAATTASSQCAKLDLPKLFRDFANAWDGVKEKLDIQGGTSTKGLIDPSAYALGKSAK